MTRMRTRPVRAVLASCAVLGLGAVATLAWFSDSEFAAATFGSSSFEVQSAAAPEGPWQSHPAGDPLTVPFPDSSGGALTVGVPVQADVWLRVDAGTTGVVTVGAPQIENPGVLAENIHATVSEGACGTPEAAVLQDGPLADLTAAEQAFTIDSATPHALCLEAELGSITGVASGESTGAVTWVLRVDEQVSTANDQGA